MSEPDPVEPMRDVRDFDLKVVKQAKFQSIRLGMIRRQIDWHIQKEK